MIVLPLSRAWRPSFLVFLAGFLLSAFPIFSLHAQSGDGFTVQERAGLVLIKPQSWSKENEAAVLEFLNYTDRTVKGMAGVGYFEFGTKQGQKRQVDASKIVEIFVYPDSSQTTDIVSTDDRDALGKQIEQIKKIIATYPATRAPLQPFLKSLTTDASQFDAGNVRFSGNWVPASQFVKARADKLIALLQSDIERTRPVSNIDLNNDPKYTALVKMGATDAATKRQVDQIKNTYDKLRRVETRAELLDRLNSPEVSLATAQVLVSQLKGLNADEDAKSALFVKRWEAGLVSNDTISKQINEAVTAFEEAMQPYSAAETPPEFPPALADKISQINRDFTAYLASKPPQQLVPKPSLVAALFQCSTGLQNLPQQFKDAKFFDANITLDQMVAPAMAIGPNTNAVVVSLRGFSGQQVELFTAVKKEADLLAASGKKAEAVLKYEAALKLVSDNEVKALIAQLKDETPSEATPK